MGLPPLLLLRGGSSCANAPTCQRVPFWARRWTRPDVHHAPCQPHIVWCFGCSFGKCVIQDQPKRHVGSRQRANVNRGSVRQRGLVTDAVIDVRENRDQGYNDCVGQSRLSEDRDVTEDLDEGNLKFVNKQERGACSANLQAPMLHNISI